MMSANYRILIADDEENVRSLLATVFGPPIYEPICAANGKEAVMLFEQQAPDLVLMDIRMPDLDGIEALQKMREHSQSVPVILMTAYAAVDSAVEALRLGAFDYVIKPFSLDELRIIVERALQMRAMKREINQLHKALSHSYRWDQILTNNPRMMALCRDIAKIAATKASVLISGESGTGKELIAKAIHYNSDRAKGPLIKVNCAALPETLLESELFGHEKGAFTGAQQLRQGLFERADKGTLFLDEVGEMPAKLQVKLLRVLQEREFERIGGSKTISTDIRLVSATNRDLSAQVAKGEFRQDLFYRLNVIHLSPPPLRERSEDIPLLARFFLEKYREENNKDIIELDPSTLDLMRSYDWPGNIRELSNALERAVIMCTGAVIFPEDLPQEMQQPHGDEINNTSVYSAGQSLKDSMKGYEKSLIGSVLNTCQGNRTQTAKTLGISRRSLLYKLNEYDIAEEDLSD